MTKRINFLPNPTQPDLSHRATNHADMASRNEIPGLSNPLKPCPPWKIADHASTAPINDSAEYHKHNIAASAVHAKRNASPTKEAPSSSSKRMVADASLPTSPLDEAVDEFIEETTEIFKICFQVSVSSVLGVCLYLYLGLLWVFAAVFFCFVIVCTLLVVFWEAFVGHMLQDVREVADNYWERFEKKMTEKRCVGRAFGV
ncbi:hypothetical protein MMC28_010201 [Mycoblastus sanguinarius]|nr:hypothetical protein [Mycoblastus sanguinarius]